MLLLLLTACPEPDKEPDDTGLPTGDDTGETDPDAVTLDGVCTDDVHWGAFLVDSNEDYAYVSGSASDGVVPVSVLTNVLTSGDCTIWRRENPFCDPGCDPGYTCSLDGECVVYPTTQDLGIVTVGGLVQAVSMEPVTPGYTYFDTSLPNPPWTPGEVLSLQTGGGAYDPVTLHGIAPVDLGTAAVAWTVVEGQPLAVTWDAPAEAVRTEVVVHLRIDQHGLTPSEIECVFADDGAGEVPAEIVDGLIGLGVTGFPAGDLARRTADKAALGDGCMDLVAQSSRVASVEVAGYTPCRRDEDCPDGETCNEELERCEEI
ncbi:MAG: hypothetical protein ACOZNI_04365 [Myxococcota bacterium]